MDKDAKIFIAGVDTLIGAALSRELKKLGYVQVIDEHLGQVDLSDAHRVDDFFAKQTPEFVFLAAGKSGGILANQAYPADFMLHNLQVECNVIQCAHKYSVKKMLYLASSCSYPKHCEQPMRVDDLLTGPLEPTNEPYAVAKIAGMKLCQAYAQQYQANFITGIPANAFGIGDDFDPEDSHVIPALIYKMHRAKEQQESFVDIWGSGSPRREFIFADDLANACIFVMENYNDPKPINLGGGTDISIKELALLIQEVVGYHGALKFDATKPDGMPLKALDAKDLLTLGWKAKISFQCALQKTYEWFLQKPLQKEIC